MASQILPPTPAVEANDGETNECLAILAGNSRVDLAPDGTVVLEAQEKAFVAALARANRVKNESGQLPKISIAFDHRGVFRRQFLKSGLSNSQQRNPRLSQLRPEITAYFTPLASREGVTLEQISVIHEDSARTHLMHLLKTSEMSEDLRRRVITTEGDGSTCGLSGCGKLTCAAITAEYFSKAATKTSNSPHEQDQSRVHLEVFFEDTPWSRTLAYGRGLQMAHLLGHIFSVRLFLVDAKGVIHPGQLAHALKL